MMAIVAMERAGLDSNTRAETMSLADFDRLAAALIGERASP